MGKVEIGSRWKPGRTVHRNRRTGVFEEMNPQRAAVVSSEPFWFWRRWGISFERTYLRLFMHSPWAFRRVSFFRYRVDVVCPERDAGYVRGVLSALVCGRTR